MPRHSQSHHHRRTRAWPWLITWALGLGGLVVLSASRHVPMIEQHLLHEVQNAIRPIVTSSITVSIHGRDATVAGVAGDATERTALLRAIAGTAGVRRTTDQLTVLEPSAEPNTSPPAATEPRDGTPDAQPVQASGPPPVPAAIASNDDVLPGVADGMEPPGMAALAEALDTDGPTDILFASARDTTGPTESLPTPEASDDLDGASPAPLAGGDAATEPIDTTPAASPLPRPSLSLTIDDRALLLQGRIGADQDLGALVQPALAAFDPLYLTNQIDTTEPTATADWIEPVAGLLPQLAELPDASLEIVDRQVTLAGTAPSPDSHDRIIEHALDTFGGYAVVERVKIDPTLPAAEPPATLRLIEADEAPPPVDGVVEQLPPAIREIGPGGGPLRQAMDALDSERLAFESGSDVMTGSSATRLDQLVDLFQAYPDVIVEIEGHTDSTGAAELNLSLSQKRASAVKRALVERGLDARRLVAYGYGEGVPVADNSTAEGRARNRRIEFRF